MGNDELIRKEDVIKEICEDIEWLESQGCTEIPLAERKERDVDIIKNLPSANDKLIQIIEEGIKATGIADEYSVGMCNGMKWCKSLLDGKEPKYDTVQSSDIKPKRGHWIKEPTEEPEWCKCSECGYTNLIVEVFSLDGYHYCPNCGAKMER